MGFHPVPDSASYWTQTWKIVKIGPKKLDIITIFELMVTWSIIKNQIHLVQSYEMMLNGRELGQFEVQTEHEKLYGPLRDRFNALAPNSL